jgi:uncharacterized protein YecE (DUF72 family)
MRGRLFLGTSGYVYPHWRRRFYPPGLPVRDWLPFYARHFATVELNAPFYRLPALATFRNWRTAVGDDFVFAVKASRYLTHFRRLSSPRAPLDRLLRRVRPLGSALGPILFQLPPQFHADLPRLSRFLRALGRQPHVAGLRAVLEVRHASWLTAETYDLLRKAGVALCFHDAGPQPLVEPVTADFVYVRRHGATGRDWGAYTEAMLRADAHLIRGWLDEGLDAYVYFNNDGGGAAVRNARRLRGLLGRGPGGGRIVGFTTRGVEKVFPSSGARGRIAPANESGFTAAECRIARRADILCGMRQRAARSAVHHRFRRPRRRPPGR